MLSFAITRSHLIALHSVLSACHSRLLSTGGRRVPIDGYGRTRLIRERLICAI
jgi:hypothetical protein